MDPVTLHPCLWSVSHPPDSYLGEHNGHTTCSYSGKRPAAQLMPFGCQFFYFFLFPLCHAFSPCSCSLMALHTHLCTDMWLWFHLWAEYHCNVCLPSWLLLPYCPLALCAGAFCVSPAGIGLFTVIKWEQRRLVDWTVTLLEWGKLQCTLQ